MATGSDILFLINGLGMGNSTRCHAIMQALAPRGHRLHVLTSGNGLTYFGDKPEVASLTAMEAFSIPSATAGSAAGKHCSRPATWRGWRAPNAASWKSCWKKSGRRWR